MRQYLVIVGFACLVAAGGIDGRALTKRQADSSLDPNLQEIDSDDNLREKRHQDLGFGVKNALLGFVFGGPQGQQAISRNVLVVSTTTKRPTTTEDIVIFEKNKPVSLDVPDKLFGSSFTLVTNLSNTVGDFMINSAIRAQRLLESMRPFLWKVFGKKGLVLEVITDKPLFSDGSSDKPS